MPRYLPSAPIRRTDLASFSDNETVALRRSRSPPGSPRAPAGSLRASARRATASRRGRRSASPPRATTMRFFSSMKNDVGSTRGDRCRRRRPASSKIATPPLWPSSSRPSRSHDDAHHVPVVRLLVADEAAAEPVRRLRRRAHVEAIDDRVQIERVGRDRRVRELLAHPLDFLAARAARGPAAPGSSPARGSRAPPMASGDIPSSRGGTVRAPRRAGARGAAPRRRSSPAAATASLPGNRRGTRSKLASAASTSAARGPCVERQPARRARAPSAPNRCPGSPSAACRSRPAWRATSRADVELILRDLQQRVVGDRCSSRTNRPPPAGPSALRRSAGSAGR